MLRSRVTLLLFVALLLVGLIALPRGVDMHDMQERVLDHPESLSKHLADHGTAQDRSRSRQVDELMKQWSGSTPGMVVLVVENDRVVHAKGYGLADMEHRVAMQTNTRFELASVSKPITALAILMLVERGQLSLDDRLCKFFPEFSRFADKVTIRHLLNHTSGMPDYMSLVSSDDLSYRTILHTLASEQLYFQPGEHYSYSNSGYMILAQIVEKVSEQRFAEFMHKNVFLPAGMKHTLIYDERHPRVADLAVPYTQNGTSFTAVPVSALDVIYGDGSVRTNVIDMYRLDRALRSGKLLSARSLATAYHAGKLNDGSETGYGFGWYIRTRNQTRIIGHSGSWGGYRTAWVRCRDRNLTVVVLSNLMETDSWSVAEQVADIYLPKPRQTRQVGKGIAA